MGVMEDTAAAEAVVNSPRPRKRSWVKLDLEASTQLMLAPMRTMRLTVEMVRLILALVEEAAATEVVVRPLCAEGLAVVDLLQSDIEEPKNGTFCRNR
jgi:hypothetical protein